jgi:hypothetical protein
MILLGEPTPAPTTQVTVMTGHEPPMLLKIIGRLTRTRRRRPGPGRRGADVSRFLANWDCYYKGSVARCRVRRPLPVYRRLVAVGAGPWQYLIARRTMVRGPRAPSIRWPRSRSPALDGSRTPVMGSGLGVEMSGCGDVADSDLQVQGEPSLHAESAARFGRRLAAGPV